MEFLVLSHKEIVEHVQTACAKVAASFRSQNVDELGGEVLADVYLALTLAVAKNPTARGNSQYVRIGAETEARRKYLRLFRNQPRQMPLKEEDDA